MSKFPGFIPPQLATLYDGLPVGDWLYEVKFDGYRMQLQRQKGTPHFYTRSGLDWVKRFSFLTKAISQLPPNVIIDGELVSVEENGRTNFSQLQADLKAKKQQRLHFYAFDLLNLSGADLRHLPQLERKRTLEEIIGDVTAPGISYSQHHTEGAKQMLAQACKMNLEGLIAKNPKAPYHSDRNENWLKLKCVQTGEYLIIGYIRASSGPGVGALRVATKDLKYAGKVGTGFPRENRHCAAQTARWHVGPYTSHQAAEEAGHSLG